MGKEKKNKRDSNIELLRIIAMVMIVAHHFLVHGGFQIASIGFTNKLWLQLLYSGGKIGVNIFILISGYFLISSEKVKLDKLFKLILQILFYSIIIYIIFVCLGIESFQVKSFFHNLLGYPVWWFARSYLILYLIHPYINKLLNGMDKKAHLKLVLYSTLVFSIIQTIVVLPFDDGDIVWFIHLYVAGSYIKKYNPLSNVKFNKLFGTAILIYLFSFITVIILDLVSVHIKALLTFETYLFEMETITAFLIAVFMFLAFSRLNIGFSKFINIVASSTFGIYLIHDNEIFRKFLWGTLFKTATYSDTLLLIPYSLLVIIIVFVVCSVIELIRIYVFEKQYMKLVTKITNKLDKKLEKLDNSSIYEKL